MIWTIVIRRGVYLMSKIDVVSAHIFFLTSNEVIHWYRQGPHANYQSRNCAAVTNPYTSAKCRRGDWLY